jgi:hypothetical protein
MKNTMHSEVRQQQRGVPPIIIDLLIKFGNREHDARGGEVLYFDKRSKKKVEKYVGGLFGKLNEHMDTYAVIASGRLITVGNRYRRINHS